MVNDGWSSGFAGSETTEGYTSFVRVRHGRISNLCGLVRGLGLAMAVAILVASCSAAGSAEVNDVAYGPLEWVVVASIAVIAVVLSGVMASLVVPARFRAQDAAGTRGPSVAENSGWQTTFFSSVIALFGTLIAALFVFMTFRVDREAREAAERAAEIAASTTAERIARAAVDTLEVRVAEFLDQAGKRAQTIAAGVATGSLQPVPTDGGNSLEIGRASPQTVAVRERLWVSFMVPSADEYTILAISSEPEGVLDPVIYLFVEEPGSNLVRLLDQNDDGNDPNDGLNARLEVELDGNTSYYLGIEGLFGSAGDLNVTVSPDN